MEFGKLENVDGVQFSLPPDDHRNFTKNQTDYYRPKLYFGCPIWSNKKWEGRIFPVGCPPQEYLTHYATRFNCIELNSTHYHSPNKSTVLRWKDSVDEHFHFCPKFPQTISHHKQLSHCEDETQYFVETIQLLEANLGTSFLQLPPYFSTEELSTLEKFIRVLPKNFSLAIEFRHPSWFLEGHLVESAYSLLESYEIASVITDVAGRRDVSHTSLPSDTAQLRLIGNSFHQSDYQRIEDWVLKSIDWLNSGLKNFYFFAHQPDNTLAPEMASYFIQKFNEIADLEIEDPLRALPKSQIELF